MARKRANGEGTIRKRADGSWEARYCADGKRHSVYGRTQAEVRKKLTEVSVTIDHGDFREDSGLTLGQWLTMWHRDYLGECEARHCRYLRNADPGVHHPRARRRQTVGTPNAHDSAPLQ